MSQSNVQSKTPNKAVLVIASATLLVTPFIAKHEGVRNHPYRDLSPRHVMTVCDGETNVPMRVYSNDECAAMLRAHLAQTYAPAIVKCLPTVGIRSVLSAMLDAAYNAGPRAVCASPMAQFARSGAYWRACSEFIGWHTLPGTKAHNGLVNRRRDEVKLCVSDLPNFHHIDYSFCQEEGYVSIKSLSKIHWYWTGYISTWSSHCYWYPRHQSLA